MPQLQRVVNKCDYISLESMVYRVELYEVPTFDDPMICGIMPTTYFLPYIRQKKKLCLVKQGNEN